MESPASDSLFLCVLISLRVLRQEGSFGFVFPWAAMTQTRMIQPAFHQLSQNDPGGKGPQES